MKTLKRFGLLALALLLPTGLLAQGTVFQTTDRFQSSRSSQCYDLTRTAAAANYFLIGWRVIGTVTGGTIKVQQSASNDCSSLSDLIADDDATANGQSAVTQGTPGSVKITVTSYAGTGTVASWFGGWVSNPAASGTLSGDVTVTDGVDTLLINASGEIACSNCGAGTQYTEDAAAAANPVGTALNLVRADTPAGVTTTDGDNVAARGTDFGALYTTLLDENGNVIPTSSGGIGESDANTGRVVGAQQLIFRSLDLDETEEEVKATAGELCSLIVNNTSTGTRWIKIYNATAASVTVGTTTPVMTVGIPGNSTDDVLSGFTSGNGCFKFGTAITLAATTGVADNDTGAPGANEVVVNAGYR